MAWLSEMASPHPYSLYLGIPVPEDDSDRTGPHERGLASSRGAGVGRRKLTRPGEP